MSTGENEQEGTEDATEQYERDLSEAERLANLMFELYPGLHRAHGKFTVSPSASASGEKVKGRATTELNAYTVKLWNKHLEGYQGLGVIPIQEDGTCQWGAIDIDVYPLDLDALEAKIHKLGLPLVVIRTKSGGAHLTMFLKENISCKMVRSRLYEMAMALGYGGVEIFPKQTMLAGPKDVGNWLNMPYFEYMDTTRYAIFKGKHLSIQQFIMLANEVRITEQQLANLSIPLSGAFEDGPPCLQLITDKGVTEGARNNTLFAMGVYAKFKYPDEWESEIEAMNMEFIKPSLVSAEVQNIIKSARRKNYFYPCTKPPLVNHCNKDLCRKREFGIGQGSEDFGLNLGSLVKITTEPPVWVIDIEGIRVQLDTEDLMMQERFRRVCVMNVNRLPPRIKAQDWDKILRDKLETVEIIEAPIESRTSGRISQTTLSFILRTPPARTKSEILMGRPWFDELTNCVMFRGSDLLKFLENNGVRSEPRKIWTALRDEGAEHQQIKINGKNAQVWSIPRDQVADNEVEVPPDANTEF